MPFEAAEAGAKRDLLLGRHLLVAQHDHRALVQDVADSCKGRVVDAGADIDALHLRAERRCAANHSITWRLLLRS
jgi:hypothetical protein